MFDSSLEKSVSALLIIKIFQCIPLVMLSLGNSTSQRGLNTCTCKISCVFDVGTCLKMYFSNTSLSQ